MTKITDKAIRAYLGHNGAECRVRIASDGAVYRYGAADPFDRSKDYWSVVGTKDEIALDMGAQAVTAR